MPITIIIVRTISDRTILNNLKRIILKIINRLILKHKRKTNKVVFLFLTVLTINKSKLIVNNLPVITMIVINHIKIFMVIMPPRNIKTLKLCSLVKVSLLLILLKNSKEKDKKIHKSLYSTINCQKKSLINSVMSLNLNNIIPNIMTLIKSTILVPHLQSLLWGKDYPVKPILIAKTLKINFLLFILKQLHPKINNILLKLSQDLKSIRAINQSKISTLKFCQKILLNLIYPAKNSKVFHLQEVRTTMMETKCLRRNKTGTMSSTDQIQVLMNQQKISPKSEVII